VFPMVYPDSVVLCTQFVHAFQDGEMYYTRFNEWKSNVNLMFSGLLSRVSCILGRNQP
jgi:hypothetical protein